MPRYVAFLRAINVGGHTVKMDRLRGMFEALGFANVETFIASGNVLFDSPAKAMSGLERKIETHLEQELGYEVVTFVRPLAALDAVLASHPWEDENASGHPLYIGFLKVPAGAAEQQKFASMKTEIDEFHFHGNEVYWLCRTRSSDSKFSGPLFERLLGGKATLRNVNTVRKLAARKG
jgi:uncharacterized protein (DUF1697 family)